MKIVCFGEPLMRLSPPDKLRFAQTQSFDINFGGAEANVAVALAQLGVDARFVSKIPAHAIGDMALAQFRRFGVDVSGVVRGGERLGIYFLERGHDRRADVCVYDRAHSSIADADPDEFDWANLLKGADRLHFSGITPALGERATESCRRACETAKRLGLKVSIDLNFRAKLWTLRAAEATMRALMPYCDLLISNASLAAGMFYGAEPDENMAPQQLATLAEQLAGEFALEAVAFTQRRTASANRHTFAGMVWSGGEAACSRAYDLDIVDRVGGGDAFAAGAIYALANGYSAQDAAEFAAAASALAHTIEGDLAIFSEAEITALARGGAAEIKR